MVTGHTLDFDEFGEFDGVRRMTATNHDNCLAALLLELTDVGLTILSGSTDGVEN